MSVARLTRTIGGAVAKASLNRAKEYPALDPKRGELDMTRLKRS
jgi:hypothetical protein